MSEFESWLPALEPSAASYARLTEALARRNRRRTRMGRGLRLAGLCAGLAFASVISLMLLRQPDPTREQQAAISASLELAFAGPHIDLVVSNGDAIAVPVNAPNVRFYWVAVATGEIANHNSSSPSPSR
ncbi:MAG: hypothetical protein AB7E72_21085 [Lysobacterales bacterium]